jgi:hypothetical protein
VLYTLISFLPFSFFVGYAQKMRGIIIIKIVVLLVRLPLLTTCRDIIG